MALNWLFPYPILPPTPQRLLSPLPPHTAPPVATQPWITSRVHRPSLSSASPHPRLLRLPLAQISLEDYTAYTLGKTERKNQTFQLQRDEEHLAQDWTVTGSVELSLSYRPVEKSKVTVTVEDGKGITCAKNQMANVFVSGGIRTSSGKTLERTKIVRNENGFPVWSEQFNLEYKNALVDEAALEINIAETFTTSHQARGTFQGHPIGSLTLSMKELLQAQAQLNQSIADELLPEESILRMYHPMLNAAGESKGELYLLISVESPKIIVARKKVAVEEAVAAAKLLPKSLMEEEGLRTEERKMVTQARKGSDSGARLFNPVKLLAALGFIGGVAFECVVRSKGSSSSPPPPAAAAAKKAAAQKVAAKKVSPWDNTPVCGSLVSHSSFKCSRSCRHLVPTPGVGGAQPPVWFGAEALNLSETLSPLSPSSNATPPYC